jgi:hypothetical protein
MKLRVGTVGHLYCLIASLFVFGTWQSQANTTEVDWTSGGFSTSHITINAGDEVDIVNYDYDFDLQLTGAPPEGFYVDIPPTDGYYIYYLPYVYYNPGTFSFSDEFGNSVTVTVNPIQPLSVTITAPTNNAVFTAPTTFTVTAVPAGGTTSYVQVQFLVGTNQTGVAYSAPFTGTVTNLLVGNYQISAIVTDSSLNTATNSIHVSVGPPTMTNYLVPVDCADIYSSGSLLRGFYLGTAGNIHGGLEFAAFNTRPYTSILLELNPYGLPLFDLNVNVYGFDNATGTLMSSNYNSGTLIGVWALPPGLTYGQLATYDVTAFVKSAQGPFFGFILVANGGDVFSSTYINYGTPPELYAIAPVPSPSLTATRAGNQIIISWPTNNWVALSLQTAATLGPGASWNAVSPLPARVGNQCVVTNSISGASRFFRLSSQ